MDPSRRSHRLQRTSIQRGARDGALWNAPAAAPQAFTFAP